MSYTDDEIELDRTEETHLPVTHRRGYGSETDDVAVDADGSPIHVPTPETPKERF